MNFDKYEDTGTHWVALFCKRNEIVHLDSFGVEYIPEEIKDFIGNENIKANSIDLMLADKKLTDFTGLFSSCHFEKRMTK